MTFWSIRYSTTKKEYTVTVITKYNKSSRHLIEILTHYSIPQKLLNILLHFAMNDSHLEVE